MTTPGGRPAKGRSAAIAARQRLAEQERARVEATTAAIEGVWSAADAQDAAREALAAADVEFRGHVDVLRAQGKSMDEIAELTGMPIAQLRAARRGGAPSVDGEDVPEGDGPDPVPDPPAAKPGGGKRGETIPTSSVLAASGAAASDPAAGGAGGAGKLSDKPPAAPSAAGGGGGSPGE